MVTLPLYNLFNRARSIVKPILQIRLSLIPTQSTRKSFMSPDFFSAVVQSGNNSSFPKCRAEMVYNGIARGLKGGV